VELDHSPSPTLAYPISIHSVVVQPMCGPRVVWKYPRSIQIQVVVLLDVQGPVDVRSAACVHAKSLETESYARDQFKFFTVLFDTHRPGHSEPVTTHHA
jgi:hypothetical protein